MSQIVIENDYEPTEKAQVFHGSDARVQVIVGGLGSGKSRAVIEEVKQTGLQYPGIPMAVYRKTMPALRDSTLHEYKSYMPHELAYYKEKIEQSVFANGSFCNFRGLDDPSKAKSTEYGLIIMEEADEFTEADFDFLNQRVRKKGNWPLRIILVLNPVDEEHWIYKKFVKGGHHWQKVGLLELHFSTYDNLKNLPEGYVDQITAGMTPDEIDRYVHGAWGSIVKGKPVYKDCIIPDLHNRKFEGIAVQLLRGWDFGFNHPACSFRLVDPLGRMNIAYEMIGDKEELEMFGRRVITETETRFGAVLSIQDYGDPRGHDKAQNGKETCFEVLQGLGIYAIGERKTREYVEPGIRQVRSEFSTLVEGVPLLTVNKDDAPMIWRAVTGRYVRDDDGSPLKDGFFEHICDADRYISHHHKSTDAVQQAIKKHKLRRLSGTQRIYGRRNRPMPAQR